VTGPPVTGPAGPYLLAVDAGTGSCRALLFTVAGEQVAVSLREWTHREPPGVPGGQDFDVEANWLGEFTVLAGTFWQNTLLVVKPLIDPAVRLRTLCHVTPGEWMLEGIGFYCGMAMRWYRDAFCDAEVTVARSRGVDPYVVMEEHAARIPPGSNGVYVYAILSNLMNARRWVHASPSFVQFDLSNPAGSGRAACIRAVEEAAAYVVRGHLGIIGELTGTRITELTFSGGAAKGTLWPQIIADVLGLPVSVPAVTESSALGAALCAGKGAGLYTSLTELEGELRKRVATFEPDQAAAAAYTDSYAGWQRIYRRMLDLSEDGLLNPLWRAAGAGPPGPAAAARPDRRAISSGQLKEALWQTATAAPKTTGSSQPCPRTPSRTR